MNRYSDIELSVVVTIYNAVDYLEKCIKSILQQKSNKIEIILIDDGSTDGSSNICDRYSEVDQRVRVIHQKNAGLVNARIAGVRQVAGSYITFIDSDDWIEENAYDSILGLIEEKEPDLICTDIYGDTGLKTNIIGGSIRPGLYEETDLLEKVIPNLIYSGTFFLYGIEPFMVSKIFRTKVLYELYEDFPRDIVNGEDAAATYSYAVQCKSIFISDEIYYHYVKRPGSMSYSNIKYSEAFKSNKILYEYLMRVFQNSVKSKNLLRQLDIYMTYMTIGLCPDRIDRSYKKILAEYGGIPEKSKVVIYGAGNYGLKLFEYVKTIDKITCVGWLDRNASFFADLGYPVYEPNRIADMDYDYVLISIINEGIIAAIRKDLLKFGVPESKILTYKWKNIPVREIYLPVSEKK